MDASRPSLCLNPAKLNDRGDNVGVVLSLKQRSDGARNPRTEDSANSDAGEQLELYQEPSDPPGLTRLNDLLVDFEATGASTLRSKWVAAVTASMSTKEQQYDAMIKDLYDEIRDQHAKVEEFVRLAKLPIEHLEDADAQPPQPPEGGRAEPNTALAEPDQGKWDLAKDSEGPFQRWRSLIASKASLEVLKTKAAQRRQGMGNTTGSGPHDLPTQRSQLINALRDLRQYSTQNKLLDTIVDIVRAFIAKPVVSQNAFINMLLMGNPGTGKTRLARRIAQVLGSLGMFIYGGDDYVEAGRSDFIAQFEGQTAIKARTFLLSNLEKVVFLDEAYSLTKYDQTGEVEAYGAEATTEIVAFLSQYVGKIAMLCAGYELQMKNDFLNANDGLSRRFPYQMVLEDYTGKHMVEIFLYSLWEALKKPQMGRTRVSAAATTADVTLDEVRTYLSVPAKVLLSDICDGARDRVATAIQKDDERYKTGEIKPTQKWEQIDSYPELSAIFSAQAGAMVNLANVAAILLMANQNYDKLGIRSARLNSGATYYVDYKSMYNIVLTLVQRSLAGKTVTIENAPSAFGGGGGGAPPPQAPPPAPPQQQPPAANAAFVPIAPNDDPMSDFLDSPAASTGARLVAIEKEEWRVAKAQLDKVLIYYGWLVPREGGLLYWKMGDNVQSFLDTEHPITSSSRPSSVTVSDSSSTTTPPQPVPRASSRRR